MTREEMITRLENLGVHVADVAAAELGKTCATCEHFRPESPDPDSADCAQATWDNLPKDGSGFCHRWESKPAGLR